jgi:hypothetical protein
MWLYSFNFAGAGFGWGGSLPELARSAHGHSKSGAGTTLDYKKRESASDSRYMHAFSGQGAQLSE